MMEMMKMQNKKTAKFAKDAKTEKKAGEGKNNHPLPFECFVYLAVYSSPNF